MDTLTELTVREINERFGTKGEIPSEPEIALIEADPRAGVRRLAGVFRKRRERRSAEARRLEAMLERERSLWARGISYVAGVDEVGVGPFAGPVAAAAVVFPQGAYIEGIRDSKELPHKRRVALNKEITQVALAIGIGMVEVEEIDSINIYQASLKAMYLAILNLDMKIQHVLVDGRTIPGIGIPQDAIPGGDRKVFSIAAASIVAKVYRDELMTRYDTQYPQYGFARNKGYGTAEHIRALLQHGPCEIHRKSFDWRGARPAVRIKL